MRSAPRERIGLTMVQPCVPRLYPLVYDVHGVLLAVSSEEPCLLESIETVLAGIPEFAADVSRGGAAVRVELRYAKGDLALELSPFAEVVFGRASPDRAEEVDRTFHCRLLREPGARVVYFDDNMLVRVLEDGTRAEIVFADSARPSPATHSCFVRVALVEILKERGLYSVHAACVEKHGRGVLIPGASGRGKTTASLALLRAGYRSISDDHPLVRRTTNSVEFLAFHGDVGLRPHAIESFPELARVGSAAAELAGKVRFPVENLYPTAVGMTAEAALVVFPWVVDEDRSWLESLPRADALQEMLPQSQIVFHPRTARAHFDALVRTIEVTRCYRLHFGRDLLDLPKLIDPLLT